MNTPLVMTLQELLRTGDKLIPQGGSEFSGYNAKRQSKYLLWRKKCLDAIGVLRENGTVLFARIANDENGMYFYQSSAQKISAVLGEALQIAQYAPEPPMPPEPIVADKVQGQLPVPEPQAEHPVVDPETVPVQEAQTEASVVEPETVPDPVSEAEPEVAVVEPETEPAPVPEAQAEAPIVEPETVPDPVPEAQAEAPIVEQEIVPIPGLAPVAEAPDADPVGTADAVVHETKSELIAEAHIVDASEHQSEHGAVSTDAEITAAIAMAVDAVEAQSHENEPAPAADRVITASVPEEPVSAQTNSAPLTPSADGIMAANDESNASVVTPVIVFSSATHQSLDQVRQLFADVSIECVLLTHTAGTWNSITSLYDMRPLPRYAVFLLSQEYRDDELLALGYLAGKYPWLTLCCIHHSTVTLPALLPGISHKEFVHAVEEIKRCVMKELTTAGYSVSL